MSIQNVEQEGASLLRRVLLLLLLPLIVGVAILLGVVIGVMLVVGIIADVLGIVFFSTTGAVGWVADTVYSIAAWFREMVS